VTTRYGRSALRTECESVRTAVKGGREKALSLAAGHVGELVAGGEVSEFDAWSELRFAARATGLPHREIEVTISKGLRRGLETPRNRDGSGRQNGACDCCLCTSDLAEFWEAENRAWFAANPDHPETRIYEAGGRCRTHYEAREECFCRWDDVLASWAA
jgi:hypothetical protein